MERITSDFIMGRVGSDSMMNENRLRGKKKE